MGAGVPHRCAVLGHPVAHSLSPVLHRAAYDALALDWSYDAIDVDESGLAGFLNRLTPPWRGLSLTMPLKRTVVPMLDHLGERVDLCGVVNTVVLQGGRRWGYNTDIPGASAALRERGIAGADRATVLGGGATATSMLLALADLGVRRLTVAARDPERAQAAVATARAHPARPDTAVVPLDQAPAADIVVSTIPSAALEGPVLERLAAAPVVFDVIYDPWPTVLASAATATGAVVISGLDLLIHQAVLQVELFTGRSGDGLVPVMRTAGENELGSRRG